MNGRCCEKFTRRVFIGLLVFLLLVALLALFAGYVLTALLIAIASHGLLLYAQLNPTSQWLGPVVTCFKSEGREIWLTLDDGPDPIETPLVLDLLDAHQAKATFFVIGGQAAAHPELVAQMVERGHQVGNHSMNHPEKRFWCLFRGQLEKEIDDCSSSIEKITGKEPLYFRAPVGHKPWSLHTVLNKKNLPLIAWSARGFDGVSGDSERIVQRIKQRIQPGAIILLHEGKGTLSETLSKVLAELADKDYRCVLPSPESFVCGRR